MAKVELVIEWIKKADEDFGYASLSLEEEFEYFPQICWHFQQAAEKILKAYVVAFDLEFRKIHDLVALLKICEGKDSTFSSIFEECKYLQKFYVETRYPVVWETKYKREDALKAEESAQKIMALVKKFISSLLKS
jgi:HEPN domain-containing protein